MAEFGVEPYSKSTRPSQPTHECVTNEGSILPFASQSSVCCDVTGTATCAHPPQKLYEEPSLQDSRQSDEEQPDASHVDLRFTAHRRPLVVSTEAAGASKPRNRPLNDQTAR